MSSRVCLLAGVFLVAVGCSQQVSPPHTVPVSGSVTLHGKPALGIRVTMHPQFSMGRITWGVVGETGWKGEFKIGTGAPGNGAPPGDYIVTFTKPKIISDPELNGVETEVDDFEGKYSDPEQSPWKVKVVKGENDLGMFNLD